MHLAHKTPSFIHRFPETATLYFHMCEREGDENKGEAGDTVSIKHCQRQREGRWCAVGASWYNSRLRVCTGYVRVTVDACNSSLVRQEGQRSLADVPQSVP